MNPEQIVERLIGDGILEANSNEELRLSAEFRESVEEIRTSVTDADEDEIDVLFDGVVDEPDIRARLSSLVENDTGILASYLALSERLNELTHLQTLRIALVTDQIGAKPPRPDGAPEWFLPISGEKLETISAMYDRCIVYIWRDDCPACDAVRENFEELFASGAPDDVMLLSIYGPECPEYLNDEFEVVGGPTTLFMLDGSVDVRIQGTKGREVLEREVQKIRERTVEAA